MNEHVIYVIGYPKSGTTWLARLLGDCLDSPVGSVHPPGDNKCIATEGMQRGGKYSIRQGHPIPTPGHQVLIPDYTVFAYENLSNERIVFIHRDPRDIVVSGAHHWGRGLKEYLLCVAHGEWPMFHGGGLVPFVRTWLHSGLPNVVTSYELLRENTENELRRILNELGLGHGRNLRRVVQRQSFESRRTWTREHGQSLNYGREFQLRFLRKGIVGDWRNHFDAELTALAQEHFGELMTELGYE